MTKRLFYVRGDLRDKALYPQIGDAIARADAAASGGGNVLFYLATPPEFFAPIVTQLGEAGLVREEGDDWRRVIVEKPFGHDLASASR